MDLERGTFHPLGATWDGSGVNFALFSEHATGVELCLFDADGRETRVPVPWRTNYVWHARVPGSGPGQRYGWRVHGPFEPERGHRFAPNKLLVDPYARAFDGAIDLDGPVYVPPQDGRDDAASKPRCVVVDPRFDWGADRPPAVRWRDTVLYELHVKGFTKLCPGVPEALRGTYLGLGTDAALRHLEALGVTTVELMPIHEHVDEREVAARGMKNYWGYSTLGFFAPDRRFATPGGDAVREFKEMVKRLHGAGIEVVLDVVYNHSCEGDVSGPTLSLRGIDNRVYYRLDQRDLSLYVDYTGCGNTLDATNPQVLKLVTDSLRYWVEEMHVDGFRFDLASALARGTDGAVDNIGAFFAVLHQDPVLSRIKLIAEPWDVGAGGYQVGNFPILWSEWNGRFRDTVRSFWRGDRGAIADLGYRLTGSSDLFADDGRHTHASINLVTAHDGFTLRDLVSYARKHNLANGEGDRDGLVENLSQNCGVEGATDDPAVLSRRRTLARSMMATMFLSQGIPMLEMGDELWRTQDGNNNPYCQDSELTWLHWSAGPEARGMLEHVRALAALRRRHPVFRRHEFLRGVRAEGSRGKDITWLLPDGREMVAEDWSAPAHAAMAFRLDGDVVEGTPDPDRGRDDSFLVLMNGEPTALTFTTPPRELGTAWRVVVDTRDPPGPGQVVRAGGSIELTPGSLVALAAADDA
ncbi:MAG TPA: glycogen debranching protein GlgX [Polyangiaceae bacterium]|jgi:glycogen operon protein